MSISNRRVGDPRPLGWDTAYAGAVVDLGDGRVFTCTCHNYTTSEWEWVCRLCGYITDCETNDQPRTSEFPSYCGSCRVAQEDDERNKPRKRAIPFNWRNWTHNVKVNAFGGLYYISAVEIGRALDYKAHPSRDINRLYLRHKGVFAPYSVLFKRYRSKDNQYFKQRRYFEPEAAWVVSLYSKQVRAPAFRAWLTEYFQPWMAEGEDLPSCPEAAETGAKIWRARNPKSK